MIYIIWNICYRSYRQSSLVHMQESIPSNLLERLDSKERQQWYIHNESRSWLRIVIMTVLALDHRRILIRLDFSLDGKAWTFDSCISKYSKYCKYNEMTKRKNYRSIQWFNHYWPSFELFIWSRFPRIDPCIRESF